MIPGYHDHERLAQTHRQDLLREAERERLLAQLPQPDRNVLWHFLAVPALLLQELRKRLNQSGKRRKPQVTNRAAQ